jgi:hypothetical protein
MEMSIIHPPNAHLFGGHISSSSPPYPHIPSSFHPSIHSAALQNALLPPKVIAGPINFILFYFPHSSIHSVHLGIGESTEGVGNKDAPRENVIFAIAPKAGNLADRGGEGFLRGIRELEGIWLGEKGRGEDWPSRWRWMREWDHNWIELDEGEDWVKKRGMKGRSRMDGWMNGWLLLGLGLDWGIGWTGIE